MPTIAKPTLGCQGLDIIEIAPAAFRGIPEFQPPQAWRVDNRATFWSCEQLAMGCRMPAATVVGSDLLRRLRRASQQLVRQCRLAYARRTNKGHSPVALEILLEITSAIVSPRADCMYWHTRSNPVDSAGWADNIICKICLVDHDHGSGATFRHQCEIALHPRQVKVSTRRGHDEDDIDIRRQELRARFACCLADQRAGPGQNDLNGGLAITRGKTYRHEVADTRQV
jgi:hypothetical protein